MESAIEQFSEKENIDILVNSAGMHGNDPFGAVTEQTFDAVMSANVKSLYFISQAVANQMIAKGIQGHILNVSSASSVKPSWTPYEISKRAVNGITEGMAHKLIKYGIVVNGIAPGPTATPMMNRSSDISWLEILLVACQQLMRLQRCHCLWLVVEVMELLEIHSL